MSVMGAETTLFAPLTLPLTHTLGLVIIPHLGFLLPVQQDYKLLGSSIIHSG